MLFYNKILAEDYLKLGNRVFITDSPDNALLVVWSVKESKEKLKINFERNPKIAANPEDVKLVSSRLETMDSSIPFKQPHPYFNKKVKVLKEVFL